MGMAGSKETLERELGLRTEAAGDRRNGVHGGSANTAGRVDPSTRERLSEPSQQPQQHAPMAPETSSADQQAKHQTATSDGHHTVLPTPELSRQTSSNSMVSGSRASLSDSIPTQKSRSSGKLRTRLTSTGFKLKQFGSMRSLAGKAH